MKQIALLLFCSIAWAGERVTVIRDEFGVPHIFAATAPGAAYGSGYAQAEDRLDEMMRNYRKAEGTMAEVFGESWFRHDYRQRMWRHRHVAEEHYKELNSQTRAVIEAFQAGVRQFMKEHPEQVPAWAPKLEPWQVVALGRFTIWGWPEGEAGSDLQRAGIEPDPVAYHGSNEWLLAPWRTAVHAPIAVIDPHLSWYGETRYYEMRVYGGDVAYSGGARVGLPFPTLGHSRYVSIAMTTGGPDTSDVYEEEIRYGKYRFRDEWLPVRNWMEKIGVKTGDKIEWKPITIEFTHHGPVVAHKNGKAYAMALPYSKEFRLIEQALAMITARNLAEMKKALAMRQYMAQIENPPQGYMQNCNISPWVMTKDSPLTPEKFAAHPYLYNAARTPAHQRAAMVLDLLAAAKNVTADQALAIAFSTEIYKADRWQDRIRKSGAGGEFARMILDWNRHSDADSRGALAYYLFKMSLGERSKLVEPPDDLSDDDVRAALVSAERQLNSDFPPGAVYGTLFRVGREGAARNWPVGGGTVAPAGMATPRAIGFDKKWDIMLGRSGQTSTQVVILTKPPQSWMVIPLGESDHPDSPHFDDQAEKLFSQARAKPTYFLRRDELEKHATAVKELTY